MKHNLFSSLCGLKGQGGDLTELKNWLSRERWPGEIKNVSLVSWRRTNATNNFDYYFAFTFYTNIEGTTKQYNAAAVVRASEIPKLKPGLQLTIKHEGVPPKRMAVIDVNYE
ncbi:hypothetical protein PGS10_01550 [Klebsiella sp. 141153]|uniref:hypothetical protein n=1 Tax=unclassified Klebsiella TaxID=2608929 RepID=UPI002927C76D|nr:hypothetical protein [Klebsiella sp. 141153]MDU9353321.1 hypothetical protein [Klebsiella sp. 141153]